MEAKQKKQILILALLVMATIIYALVDMIVVPLNREISANTSRASLLEAELARSGEEVKRLRKEEQKYEDATAEAALEQIVSQLPQTHQVQIPEKLRDLLQTQQLPPKSISLVSLAPFGTVTDLLKANWDYTVQEAPVMKAGEATAATENAFPFSQVTDLQFDANSSTGTVRMSLVLQSVVLP